MAEGTFQCPVLACDKSEPHAHGHGTYEQLNEDRVFLAQDVALPLRVLDAAKLLRRELAATLNIGPNDGSDPVVTAAWRRLFMARQTLEHELYSSLGGR